MKYKLYLTLSALGACFLGCDRQDDLYAVQNAIGPKISDIIAFQSVTPTQPEADSAGLCTVTVKINPEAAAGARDVRFVISDGKFTTGDTGRTVAANAEGKASIALLSWKAGPVKLKATVSNYSIDTTILFATALPDNFLLSADKYVSDSTQPVTVTTALVRNPGRGKPTDPVTVFYKVSPLDTVLNLVYPDFAFSQNRTSVITINNPYKLKGRFIVEARTKLAIGDTLRKNFLLRIN